MNQNRLKWGSRDGKLGKLRLRFVRISKAAIQDDEAAVRHKEANIPSTPSDVVQERTAISHSFDFRLRPFFPCCESITPGVARAVRN